MKVMAVDGTECDAIEMACWAAAYGAAFAGEVLAMIRCGVDFSRSLDEAEHEAARLIADAAVRAMRSAARPG